MCESNVYLVTDGEEELILSDVATIRPSDGGFRLLTILGEERLVRGRIRDIDLLKHRIVLDPLP